MSIWISPKLDWKTNPTNPVKEDFNRIEGNIDFLKTDIETKKGVIVSAINDMNQSATISDTHAQLAGKIKDISKDANAAAGDVEKSKTFYQGGLKKTGTLELTGDAVAGNVLAGKTFYNTNLKTKVTGTVADRGKKIITPGTANIPLLDGFYSGSGYVEGDADLVPNNILKDKNIFGVVGKLAVMQPGVLDGSDFYIWNMKNSYYSSLGAVVGNPKTLISFKINISGWITVRYRITKGEMVDTKMQNYLDGNPAGQLWHIPYDGEANDLLAQENIFINGGQTLNINILEGRRFLLDMGIVCCKQITG